MARLLSGVNSSTQDLPTANLHVGTDFLAIIAAFLCALICILGLFAMARCTCIRRRRTTSSSSSASHSHSSASKKGVDKKLIQSLPKFTFTSSTDARRTSGFTTEECVICLTEFVKGNEIRVLPDCGHGFHLECIDKWLSGRRSSCPSCRQCLAPVRCEKCGHTPTGRKALEEGTFLP